MFEDLKPGNHTVHPSVAASQGPAKPDNAPAAGFPAAPLGPEAAPQQPHAEPASEAGHPEASEPANSQDWQEPEMADWKAALRRDFEEWLAGLDTIPESEEVEGGMGESPDLYSFYEELAAANAESRKSNRRTAEAISQWSDVLGRFESGLTPLRETVAQLAAVQPKEGQLSRGHCLMLVELLDRLQRLGRAFESPPAAKRWWGGSTADWRKAWETQRQAFGIVVGHLAALLKQEGVTPFDTVGRPFDPSRMTAVAAEPDASRPPQTVSEEIAPGYLRGSDLLRPAQVKVTRQP
jgi:molecular chaperone GrpE